MRRIFEYGGFIAAAVLIVFGIGAMVMGINARGTVHDTLAQEQIVGTPDMTPQAIKAEAKQAGLDVNSISFPTESVAGLPINSGDRAHAFAGYMRIHALEATGGQTYAQMPRYATADGKGTNDPAQALKVNGQPQDNGARQVWITETALATALQSSYMASQLALFAIVVGHRHAAERDRVRRAGRRRRASQPRDRHLAWPLAGVQGRSGSHRLGCADRETTRGRSFSERPPPGVASGRRDCRHLEVPVTSKPASRNTFSIRWLSGLTSATNRRTPTGAASSTSCSKSRVATP